MQGQTPIQLWNNRIRMLRKQLRGWARHITSLYKKKRIAEIIDKLDLQTEIRPLSDSELTSRKRLIGNPNNCGAPTKLCATG